MSEPRRGTGVFVTLLMSAGVLFLLGLIVLRTKNPISYPLATGLIGLVPLAFFATPFVLGYGIWARRWLFVGVGVPLILLFGYWASADIRFGAGKGDRPEDGIRLATANLFQSNLDPVGAAADAVREDPDIILFQELTPELWAQLELDPVLADYPYRQINTRGNPDGGGIVSRVPILDGGVHKLGTNPITWITIDLDGTAVQLINVHLSAPLQDSLIERGSIQHRELKIWLSTINGPVIVAGDFNATVQHDRLKNLMAGGLYDAHQQAGRWLGATWGLEELGPLPAMLRIDHVLYRSDISAVHAWTRPMTGSDHKILVADLLLSDE